MSRMYNVREYARDVSYIIDIWYAMIDMSIEAISEETLERIWSPSDVSEYQTEQSDTFKTCFPSGKEHFTT